MKVRLIEWFLICLTGIAFAGDSPFVGIYQAGEVVIEVREEAAAQFSGTISTYGESVPFTAVKDEDALVGTLEIDGESLAFRLTLDGSRLTFAVAGESQILLKRPQETIRIGKAEPRPEPANTASALRVNGVLIEADRVLQFEQETRMQIPRGDFWYDKVSGAWGIAGGPTLGFTAAGMDLGGPLKADASRGATGVFINGRQLPLQDVRGLQNLGVPVQLGRWWVDHQGNFGIEGNPMIIGNLFQFSRGKGGSYQRATAGGYIGGDGTTSYFFDPKSGSSVMTGP